MSWFSNFLASSIGQKVVMSLTGLFLMLFLLVHLAGNLQLLKDDGGQAFNLYADFMTSNPLIKTISIGLYIFILLHAFQGMVIWRKNRIARKQGYAVSSRLTTSFASRNMGWLGVIIFIFLLIHMWQFWFQMKTGALNFVPIEHDGQIIDVKNLYEPVELAFSQWWYVAFYVFSMIVVAFHLYQGFQSAFQTLGWNHKRFSNLISLFGILYSIAVPLAFAIIPVYFYFFK